MIQSVAVSAAIGSTVFWLVYNRGTFSLTTRSALAIAVWWAIVLTVVLGLAPLRRPPVAAAILGSCLFALTLWTLASSAWAPNGARAFDEFNRDSLYLGVFVIIVAFGSVVGADRWADGLALGIAAIGVYSLATRLFPELADTATPLRQLPGGQSRLAYPIGYWNALGVLLAVGLPLVLRVGLEARNALVRGLAAATVPAFVAAMYLTSSRAGSLAAVSAVLVFVVACNKRVSAFLLLGVTGAGAVVVVSSIHGRSALVNGPLDSAAAASQGHAVALPVAVSCLGAGVVWTIASRQVGRIQVRSLERAVAAALVVLAAAALVAVHPARRFNEFKQNQIVAVNSPQYTTKHLLSASGNGRWQLWTAAGQEWRAHPLAGGGAGSFQSWWLQHRPYSLYVVNAHSLFMEVLAELGLVGLLLLCAFFGGALVVGLARVRRARPERTTLAAALVAGLVAYVLGAAVDWMWQVTALTVVAVAVVAALASGRAPRLATTAPRRVLPYSVVAAVGLLGIAAIGAQTLPLISALELKSSHREAASGDLETAAKRAAAARSAAPWSPDPYLQLALIQEYAGVWSAARRNIEAATARDPRNWQMWAIRARIEAEAGAVVPARESLHRAAALNPLWAKSMGVGA